MVRILHTAHRVRILHTADWHLGQMLRGWPRLEEQRAVLGALVARVADLRPDVLIVAGDVYDSQNPSGEAQALFYETLAALHRAHPAMATVITAGNHDAAGRLEAPQALLAAFRVHIVGGVRRHAGGVEAGRHLVTLRGPDGAPLVDLLAVSYPTAACLPALARLEAEDGSPVVRAVAALYGELAEGTRAARSGAPLVVTGHLHVAGGLESEGAERRILIGGEHAVPPAIFPTEAAYVALGHLHRAQSFARREGAPLLRYAGSLMPLSAAEAGYAHGVTLVTIEAGAAAAEHLPLPRPVPFLRLPEVAFSELAGRLAALALPEVADTGRRPFLQITLARRELPPGFREEVERLAAAFPVRLVETRVAAAETMAADDAPATALRLAERSPAELFELAFRRAHGDRPPEAAHRAAFDRALERAREDA